MTRGLALLGMLLLAAQPAAAARVFDLFGVVTVKVLGQSFSEGVTGTLELFDDRTFTFDLEGDVSSGIWLQEGSGIQLLTEEPSASESIEEFEQEVSEAAEIPIQLTRIQEKSRLKEASSGDIALKGKVVFTIREAGVTDGRALKVSEVVKLIGLLR